MPFSLSESSCSSEFFKNRFFSKVAGLTFDEFWNFEISQIFMGKTAKKFAMFKRYFNRN